MKVVIFAGGVGSRLWPLSRKHTPKQFEKIVGEKSTLQLAVERVSPLFKPEDIFISSGERFKDVLYEQLPQLPRKNILLEPEMRDVGAAVGLVTAVLAKIAKNEPFIILWSDHLVKNVEMFRQVISAVGKNLERDKERIIFMGQKPRFASQNLGWIEYGKKEKSVDGLAIFSFKSFHYRPDHDTAEKFLHSKQYFWNPGYFGTTPGFLFSLYKKFAPEMYEQLLKIQAAWDTPNFSKKLSEIYPKLQKVSFDNLILERISSKDAYVVGADLGWSDIGAWESLKEALAQREDENVTRGKVMLTEAVDTLVFNYTDQLVVGIDLNEFLVINTEDVLLICPKNSVPKIKKLVENLSGSPHEHLT
ncbi:MAG: hypothetical protein HY430_03510 [Candidatus Levybacteria bacterium]|nr:hypothetical protein [Candidatus Levybacteria bacterium]